MTAPALPKGIIMRSHDDGVGGVIRTYFVVGNAAPKGWRELPGSLHLGGGRWLLPIRADGRRRVNDTGRVNETCTCGHVADEHDKGYEKCQVEDCPCVHFEASGE